MLCGTSTRKKTLRFIHDAFLIYGPDAYDFVTNDFSRNLEDWGVNMFTPDDFEWGSSIPANFVEAIDASRWIICLLTPGRFLTGSK